jgi:hypothetical protein
MLLLFFRGGSSAKPLLPAVNSTRRGGAKVYWKEEAEKESLFEKQLRSPYKKALPVEVVGEKTPSLEVVAVRKEPFTSVRTDSPSLLVAASLIARFPPVLSAVTLEDDISEEVFLLCFY